MAPAIGMVTTDCADPKALSTFWAAALGTSVSGDYGEFVMLAPPPAGGPVLGFQRVPEERAGKNRLHLDLSPDDRDGEVERLVNMGARRVDIGQGDHSWVVLADPEGNEFCVLRSRPAVTSG